MSTVRERGPIERWVRGGWGRPGPVLRSLAAVYGTVADVRNGLWDAGVFRPARATIPVISLGGLTVGGSAKTPLAAAIARSLSDAGARVAVVTAGQPDELLLHREINPDVMALGGRWRLPLVARAAADGAEVAVLDSGFQHRRLHRDLDIVVCNVDQAHDRARLPAGPSRERFAALARADAVILMRRTAAPAQADELAVEVLDLAPHAHIASAHLRAGGLRPANEAAASISRPDPAVGLAGVMWPESFFRTLEDVGFNTDLKIALSDHPHYDQGTIRGIAKAAGDRGVVGTRKDTVQLVRVLAEDVPVWWLKEDIAWDDGGRELLAATHRVVGLAR